MNVSKLIPKPEKKIEFIYKNINLVPRKMGCYVLTNFNNEIIYLGLTDNLSRRLKEHLENEEKNKLTAIGKYIGAIIYLLKLRKIFIEQSVDG
jgi:excinuclease UvrABC nuclease subunit